MINFGWNIPTALQNSEAFLAAKRHAIASPEKEICGPILARNNQYEFEPYDNVSPTPQTAFRMPMSAHLAFFAGGKDEHPATIVHSHVGKHPNPTFSGDDAKTFIKNPQLVFSGDGFTRASYFDPAIAKEAPYEGRPWHRHLSNCYTLTRDFINREKGIDFDRLILTAAFKEGYQAGNIVDLGVALKYPAILSLCSEAMQPVKGWRSQLGFAQGVSEAELMPFERGDVVIFPPIRGFPGHIGVMLEPESCKALHQQAYGISCAEVLDSSWRKEVAGVFRCAG